jgi:hypothetical protein
MHPELAEAIHRATQRLKALDRAEFERRLLDSAKGGLAADLLDAGVFPIREDEALAFESESPVGIAMPQPLAQLLLGPFGTTLYGESGSPALHPLPAASTHDHVLRDEDGGSDEGYRWVA